MVSAPSFENTVAVVVTYRPDAGFGERLTRISQLVKRMILVDNGTENFKPPEPIELIKNPANGLARAQNMGIKEALAEGAEWVLLFDDDSLPEPDMLARMSEAYQMSPDNIGLITPNLHDEQIGEPAYYYVRNNFGISQARFENQPLIDRVLYSCASGSLIPKTSFEKIGFMNEDYFMYFVDTEFCLRLNQAELRIIAVKDAVLHHKIGAREVKRFLGMKMIPTNHRPEARYYMARNRLKLWKFAITTAPSYIVFDAARLGYELLRTILFEEDKFAQLSAIALGLQDGVMGKSGKKSL